MRIEKRNWEESIYKKVVRLSEENHEFLKKTKRGRKSIAGYLNDIINQYKKKYGDESLPRVRQ